jgi:hypothetical protein
MIAHDFSSRTHRQLAHEIKMYGAEMSNSPMSRLIDWTMAKLGVASWDWPKVYLVEKQYLPPHSSGVYLSPEHVVAVDEALSPDDQERVVIHELTHAWSTLRDKGHDEAAIIRFEEILHHDWLQVRPRWAHLYQ